MERIFSERFGSDGPIEVCRAPGRVNLIGEHTDYNGLPVLPMTLSQDIHVAYRPRNDGLFKLRNFEDAFPDCEFNNGPAIEASQAGSWDNYVKAAVQGLNDTLSLGQFPGADLLVGGTLPRGAGLSSSSALVVASALAYLGVLEQKPEEELGRLALAEVLAEAEHYVGTQGGAMDHTVILNGAPNHACKIDFNPLKVELAPLPKHEVLVVCHSLVRAEKTGAARHRYNAGPRMCRLACVLVEAHVRREFDDEIELERLGDLWYGPLCLTTDEVSAICGEVFRKPKTPLAEALQVLDRSEDDVRQDVIGDLPEPKGGFPLQARVRHLCTEYRRVESARDALLNGESERLGELMNDSHESCAEDFEISCPELDRLVTVARDAGALGSRLTGAGFGGATVSLVPGDELADFTEGVTQAYYRDFMGYTEPPPIFVAEPGPPAGALDGA